MKGSDQRDTSRSQSAREPVQSTARHQRCAIYTRVSTDHGLDMEFNSLDAQREACEAYITSQKHEGWQCLSGQYNDGGYSGGSLERPDLRRLMDDVRKGRLDIIVVYKVDRLTRSLADFAKLVELFDAHGVSFVSVTQSFNTTSSMGRLTLNVLLSFAQFEREVTGERIRDKIAASKKKGIRMGGPVPLGYTLCEKKLIIDEAEATAVRSIFDGYLEHGTLTALMRHLDSTGVCTKRTVRKDGSTRGGGRFGKGALAYVLRNRVYIGEIIHKGHHYAGEHQPIIDRKTFDAVQDALARPDELRSRRKLNGNYTFLLAGKIVDDRGNRMKPTIARKNGVHYRYYVSSALAQGRLAEAGNITRIPAKQIEDLVAAHLAMMPETRMDRLAPEKAVGSCPDEISPIPPKSARCLETLARIVITNGALELSFLPVEGRTYAPLMIPWAPTPHRRRREVIALDINSSHRPIRAETRARLLLGIAKARHWLEEILTGRAIDLQAIAKDEGCSERTVRQNINLAFLPPTIVRAALDATLPETAGITTLIDAPMLWADAR